MTTVKVAHFDKTNSPPIVVMSEFTRGADGTLVHYTDGNLRATIPPEGWDDYLKDWPEAQAVVDSLRLPRGELHHAVQAMLAASQSQLADGTEIILPADAQGDANPDHPQE